MVKLAAREWTLPQSIAGRTVEPLWTVEEIALECGVSAKTIRRRQEAGLMPPRVRICRAYRYRDSDVRSWLNSVAAKGNQL